jgi:protein gp37
VTDQRNGGIAWCDETWNPVRGCSRVSAGCRNCYAERVAARFANPGQPYHGLAIGGDTRLERTAAGATVSVYHPPRWTGEVRLVPELLDAPLRWRRRRRVFVNSMSDLFHERLRDEAIAAVFGVMSAAPKHTFMVLTKRPERMRAFFAQRDTGGSFRGAAERAGALIPRVADEWKLTRPLPNVWLGVSVEDQASADARIPLLLDTPAAVRFVSYEPAIGPLDFSPPSLRGSGNWLGHATQSRGMHDGLDWIIVGGESGPGARRCDVAWIRSTIEQCRAAKVPCFVKQLGRVIEDRNDSDFDGSSSRAWPAAPATNVSASWQGAPLRVFLRDRKGADPAEWPEDLRVREFPNSPI